MGTNVYIVDDDEAVRDSLRALLESQDIGNFFVKDYDSGKAFLDDISNIQEGCLLLDFHMPELTGLELLQLLREKTFSIPTVFITAQCDPLLKKRVLEAGAYALLNKPVEDQILFDTIAGAMASGRSVYADTAGKS